MTVSQPAVTGVAASEERLLRDLLSGIEFAAFMLDAAGKVRFVNDHLLRLLDRDRDGLMGTDWVDLLPHREHAKFVAFLGTALHDGRMPGPRERGILTRSGAERRVVWTSVVQRGPDGRPNGLASIGHDVTELHLLEAERTLLAAAVAQSARDVSHTREVEAELILEARVRGLLGEAILAAAATTTLEGAAQAVCDGLASLPGVDVAHLIAFVEPDGATVIASHSPSGSPLSSGQRLPGPRARYLRERAADGPWGERAGPDAGPLEMGDGMAAAGVQALAFGPIGLSDTVGILVVGTCDPRYGAVVATMMPNLVGFGVSANTVLTERLRTRRRDHGLRAAFDAILATSAFRVVFQPIVDLRSGDTIGYEALTRFDSGERPDHCFADAWTVGMGVRLELATLKAAVEAARGLPAGRWLDLNVSPRLLEHAGRLATLLDSTDRAVVMEITEHERIDDYAMVREAAAALGNDVRLAVDDAGVGIANFGHIIGLRPDFVKIDISLIRRVNADPGRQALVIAMAQFARTAGCRLVAEGVETEAEARTLRELNVDFAQGYWYGRPAPAEHWTTDAAIHAVPAIALDVLVSRP